MPQGANRKDSAELGERKAHSGLLDLDLDDVEGVIEILIDSDDSFEDDFKEASTSTKSGFGSAHDVFVVRRLSKVTSGFRPAVTCEGFQANVSRTSSGYTLLPRATDQQLSFKYEPPSPKFSCRRPSCISYRLQLLQGSQFLYSLRGLPKALRCQRSAHALEWGHVHMVFAAAADLDTFLATLKYVEVEEMAADQQQYHEHQHQQQAQHRGGVSCGAARSHAHSAQRKDGHKGHVSHSQHGGCSNGSGCGCQVNGVGSPLFAAAGAAMLAAVTAACLLAQRGGGVGGGITTAPGRKRLAESSAKALA